MTGQVAGAPQILALVAELSGVSVRALTSPRCARCIARPRQVAMYLMRTHTTLSLPQIGLAVGGRDHTTVMHAVRVVGDILIRGADTATIDLLRAAEARLARLKNAADGVDALRDAVKAAVFKANAAFRAEHVQLSNAEADAAIRAALTEIGGYLQHRFDCKQLHHPEPGHCTCGLYGLRAALAGISGS